MFGKGEGHVPSGKLQMRRIGPERSTNCLQFAERWNSPEAEAPGETVKHAEEPAVTATDPGDQRPAGRNRDSTKQHAERTWNRTRKRRGAVQSSAPCAPTNFA